MVHPDNAEALIGGLAFDSNGDRIGKIGMIYLDDQTGEPAWATINTGLFGTHESFVPLVGATRDEHDLRVPFSKEQVREAPALDVDAHLDPAQEDQLYEYYGLTSPDAPDPAETPAAHGLAGASAPAGEDQSNLGAPRNDESVDTDLAAAESATHTRQDERSRRLRRLIPHRRHHGDSSSS